MLLSRRRVLGTLGAIMAAPAPSLGMGAAKSVIATTGMIADAAQRIGDDAVVVGGLMGPGVDPHAYRQTRTDISAMLRADLVLHHGLRLEAQMEEFLDKLGRRNRVVAVAESLAEDALIAHPTYENQFDPHIWMDPALWSGTLDIITDALVETQPAAEDALRGNAGIYAGELSALDSYARKVLATVPEGRRVLVTAHDAFGYFGRAYDFDVVGIQGISTESEAGLNRIAVLVDLLVEREVEAVFVETSVADRNVRALIEGAAARGHDVRIGGELFSDAMGPDGTYEGTYPGMIDHNVTTIARALGGEAPERGLHGRLGAK